MENNIAKEDRLMFSPKEDITAYELARLLPLIIRGPGGTKELKSRLEELDKNVPNIERHIKKYE